MDALCVRRATPPMGGGVCVRAATDAATCASCACYRTPQIVYLRFIYD